MSDAWHYVEGTSAVGPVSFEQLCQLLVKRQNPRDARVWCARFTNWMRAEDVPELRAALPPPLPPPPPLLTPLPPGPPVASIEEAQPTWRVPWWWYVFCLFGFISIGNRVGRAEMGRMSALRSQARQAKKLSRLNATGEPSAAKVEKVVTEKEPAQMKKGSTFWLILSIIFSPLLWLIDSTAMSNFWTARTPLKKSPEGDKNSSTDSRVMPKNRKRLVAFLIVLALVLVVGAIYSTIIYDNSAAGIANLVGRLIGTLIITAGIGLFFRRATYTPAVVLAVAAISVAVSEASMLVASIEANHGIKEIREVGGLGNVDAALKQDPTNSFLQLMAGSMRLAKENAIAQKKIWDGIEPPALANSPNFATATRNDLKTYLNDLRTAEANAKAVMPNLIALDKEERDKAEKLAQSLHMGSVGRDLLNGVDRRHTRTENFNSNMLAARAEHYHAVQNYVSILIEQYGNYTVEQGRFIFRDNSVVSRFNAALDAVNAAAQRVEALGAEAEQLTKAQQNGMNNFGK